MKVVICAVPYSDNLGDGVIAQTLTQIILLKYPFADVKLLDIAGRTDFACGGFRGGPLWGYFSACLFGCVQWWSCSHAA